MKPAAAARHLKSVPEVAEVAEAPEVAAVTEP